MRTEQIFLSTLFALLLCFGIAGCGKQTVSSVSAYDLQSVMLAADESLPDMTTVNSSADNAEDLFTYLSDLDYDKVEGYFLAYSSEGKADEVAVIILKDSADADAAVESLSEHVQSRVSLYQSYEPTEKSRAEKAEVFSQDNYAVLIISDNADDIKAAFESELAA